MEARQHAVVLAIIAVITVIFIGQESSDDGYAAYCAVPTKLVAAWNEMLQSGPTIGLLGRFATLFTATLLHADVSHIAYNMIFLWVFGPC